MNGYQVPAEETRTIIEIQKSKFIANAAPAFSVEEAQLFIKRIHSQFPDASHHVPAYRIGYGSSVISHCSDAGEPSGTAGRPVLAVLTGSGLGDICVVVTRYFGGIKLGTGGLVKAYTAAAKSVLEALPRANKISAKKFLLTLRYHDFESVRKEIERFEGRMIDQRFESEVTITAIISQERYPLLVKSITEITNGTARFEVLIDSMNILLPVRS